MNHSHSHLTIEQTFRQESGRLLAALISWLGGDFEMAEDGLQDALIVALERWPVEGIPRTPAAWITTTAHPVYGSRRPPLHLLPSGTGRGGPDRAHPAHTGRIDHR